MNEDASLYFEECGDLLCVLTAEGNDAKSLTIDKVNKAWTSVLGWSKQESVGKPFTANIFQGGEDTNDDKNATSERAVTALAKLCESTTPSADAEEEESFVEVNKQPTDQAMEDRFLCKDGSFRWIAWKVNRLSSSPNKFIASGREFTAQKENQDSLRNGEKRVQESLKIAKLGQWDLDLVNNNLVWSDQIYSLFQIDQEKFGASYEAFLNAIHPDDRDLVNTSYLSHLETKEPYEIIHRLLFPDGKIKWVIESCRSEFDNNGTPLRSIGTVQDITELKQAQEDLQLAKEHAVEADNLKSAFLANMSHEIRTPMNAVIGFTDLMLMDTQNMLDDHREYLETIKTSGKLLLMLINDILDISKIEAGQLHLENRCFSLGEILKTVEYNATALIQRKGHHIDFKTPSAKGMTSGPVEISGVQDTIVGDPNRLQQILNNLLSNAIKFTDAGSVSYKVKILVRPGGKLLEFSVKDTGKGIPAKMQQDIFEPFRQAHGGRGANNTLGGTGLGLSIARRLVEMMGGEISLESSTDEHNHGSTFRFTMPYVPAKITPDAVGSGGRADFSSAKAESNLPKLAGTVLLVDDNRVNLKLADRFLTKMGCESTTAENGSIAIAKFRSDPSIDVILMDKEMPVMDGLEAVRNIREIEVLESRKRIPIIAVTAAAMAEDREECLQAGCDDYITKPLNRVELHRMLSKYLKVR
eukprot:CAMPEP_0172450448 /NCGR_PEP_ID=MMETSP1065-20121228/8774_1 /TAXON_ID=265537 /ORGANISM="Amphiprora paludosa, Strain CCMP125" /LENGTH=697 /DNA_ID=CAMNT_0013202229 /DNA_START=202 /DNA_END=2295 /DNA_ORIENTATION=+